MNNNIFNNSIWAADYIVESSGIACGDQLSIYIYNNNGKIFFTFLCFSCSISKKFAKYLEISLSGKSKEEILINIERLKNKKYLDCEKWILDIPRHRYACIESVINTLASIFKEDKICSIEEAEIKNEPLACDACVSVKKINWQSDDNNTKKKSSFIEIIHNFIKNIEDKDEILLQKYAVDVLNDNEIDEFKKLMNNNISEKTYKKIKKLRLAAPYYNNAFKYGVELNKKLDILVSKQIASMMISNEEIKIIEKYIKNNNLKIDSVKGGKTNIFYPKNMYRTHMDYDFLSSNIKDAFILINYLINIRGFRLVVGGSVPFSFKTVFDNQKNETLTGHIHLEKVLQDRYQVIIDINMGGFPLGRTSLIKCNDNGKLDLEDLICITLAHLFKHEHAFIKDINDLYYLLESSEVNKELLLKKINDYNLKDLFFLTYNFLRKNMKLKNKYKSSGNKLMLHISKNNWPYSKKRHFLIKLLYMFNLCIKQYGLINGIIETKKQLCGFTNTINTKKYKKICSFFNQRTYLYPIIFFNKYFNFDKIDNNIEFIDDIIGIYNNIAIFPIGLFIIQTNDNQKESRENIQRDINYIFSIFNILENDCNYHYIMEARKDIWLY